MRTTVEIPDHQRARLLELAAERGEVGFSKLVQEAIAMYLKANQGRRDRIEEARSVLGAFNDDEAQSMRDSVTRLREKWR